MPALTRAGVEPSIAPIAFEAVARHLQDGLAEKTAIRWLVKDLTPQDISFRELAALISRFAHLLERLGVAPGERLFSLLGRVPELYVAALGTRKAGRVFSPLFSAFGPEPVRSRMAIGDARFLAPTAAWYRRKVAPWLAELPGLTHVLLTDAGNDPPPGTLGLQRALADCPDTGGLVTGTSYGIIADYDLSRLRFLASVGEPLSPEAVVWGRDVIGLPFHDSWWQTEAGAIMIANYRSQPIKPVSVGRALPGIEAAIVQRAADTGAVTVVASPDTPGQPALRPGWPSMFRGYLHEPERYAKCYAKCFADGWYLTGDLAQRDADGWSWLLGRADDMIESAGHLIGPFEVESALVEHDAVAEAAAIGIP